VPSSHGPQASLSAHYRVSQARSRNFLNGCTGLGAEGAVWAAFSHLGVVGAEIGGGATRACDLDEKVYPFRPRARPPPRLDDFLIHAPRELIPP
jgi:hypothetical protein